MADKFGIDEKLSKSDLETILQVNKKAVEISSDVSSQNEEILEQLDRLLQTQINCASKSEQSVQELAKKIDKAIDQNEDISRDLFQIKVLFLGALIQIVLEVISLFVKH